MIFDINPFSFFCEYAGFEKFPFVQIDDMLFVADSNTVPEHLFTPTGGRHSINFSHWFDVFPLSSQFHRSY